MRATLSKALPYIFVHEADEKKGGAPLATLKLELQDEVQRRQLFDGRRVTQCVQFACDREKLDWHCSQAAPTACPVTLWRIFDSGRQTRRFIRDPPPRSLAPLHPD